MLCYRAKIKPIKQKRIIRNNNKQYFKNCADLRKVYPNGVPKGNKAYQAQMDRDHDNYACETE